MEEIDLKELLDYFKNKLTWILVTIIVVIGIGNTFTILTRIPMYQSSTTIVLASEKGGESSYNSTEWQLNKNLVGTYSEIIRSRKILDEVIKNLGLNYKAAELSKNVSVSAVADTEIIKITVSDANNKKASKIANEISNVFMTEIPKIYKLNNVSVLDKAEASVNPYNVNYVKDNAIYMLIGLVLSCGVIFIKFYFDTTIKTSEEIENKLGLTVLGIVPRVERN